MADAQPLSDAELTMLREDYNEYVNVFSDGGWEYETVSRLLATIAALKEQVAFWENVYLKNEMERENTASERDALRNEVASLRDRIEALERALYHINRLNMESRNFSPQINHAIMDALSGTVAPPAGLVEALTGLVEAVTAEVSEKGGGGYILARLSDARAALANHRSTNDEQA